MLDSRRLDGPSGDETFAANRAVGRVVLSVAATAGCSRRARVYESGSLRVRFPNTHSPRAPKSGAGWGSGRGGLDAVIVNTAGGIAGGDRLRVEIAVGSGAQLTVTSAAAEKVYRSLGPNAEINVKLGAAAAGVLAWLPQETILFDRARLRRTVDVELARGAGVILAEATIFGRSAKGEAVRCGYFFDRWLVRAGGTLIFADTMRLDGAIAGRLAEQPIAGGAIAVANVLKYPADVAGVAAVRAIKQSYMGEVGVSAWNGLAFARLLAPDGASLRRDIIAVLAAFGGQPPRLWWN